MALPVDIAACTPYTVSMPLDLYVLVHPEHYPSNDPEAIHHDPEIVEQVIEGFDERYGQQIVDVAHQAQRSVCILDPMDVEWHLLEPALDLELVGEDATLEELQTVSRSPQGTVMEVAQGAPAALFELRQAYPGELAATVADLHPDTPGQQAVIGGFHRDDCVRRVAQALANNGWNTRICATTTMPLL